MLFFLQGKLFSITHSLTSLRLLLNVTFRVRLSLSILFKIIPLSPYNIFYLFICVIYIALTITCIRAGFFSCSLLFTAISPGLRTVPATKMLKNMLSFCLTRTYYVSYMRLCLEKEIKGPIQPFHGWKNVCTFLPVYGTFNEVERA